MVASGMGTSRVVLSRGGACRMNKKTIAVDFDGVMSI